MSADVPDEPPATTGRRRARTSTRPAAAAMSTDDESGTEGLALDDDTRRSLRALEAMRARGLIGEAEFAERKAKLTVG